MHLHITIFYFWQISNLLSESLYLGLGRIMIDDKKVVVLGVLVHFWGVFSPFSVLKIGVGVSSASHLWSILSYNG